MHPNKIINNDLEDIITSDLDWQRFRGKTILISGANGFLPAYMVETLLHLKVKRVIDDVRVIALVRDKKRAEAKFAHHIDNPSLTFIVQDVSEPIIIKEKIDFIIHAASQASPKYYGTDPVGTLMANVYGTRNMLDLAHRNKIESMLNFSSGEVNGNVQGHERLKEDDYGYIDICNVRSCYAESKRMGETMCVSWCHQHHVPVKSVRPFHTYGPGMLLDDGRVFADFVGNIVRGEDILIHSDGNAVRAFCYLSDATSAFFTLLLKGEPGRSYNVGNPSQSISIKELAITLTNIYPEKNLKVQFDIPKSNYLQSTVAINSPNIDRMMSLGWHPSTDIKTGFKRTIDSYIQ